MAASYPASAKAFTTKVDGPGNTILAAHVNDLQLEVTAIETDLVAGLPIARGGTGLTSPLAANRIPYSTGSVFTSAATFIFDGTTFTVPATVITALLDLSGAAAGQIKFPATQDASTNANTLDDYEEGVWTPVIGGSGGTSGQAYSIQVGKYVKIGKLVTAYFFVTLSTLGTVTTTAQIQGLPFTTENTANLRATVAIGTWANMTSTLVNVAGYALPNATAINLTALASAAVSMADLVQADMANTTSLIGSITYAANA